MAQLISVKLSRFDGSPWGFRLQGGKDFGTPLIVQKVNGGSPAEAAGLRAGDAVIKVNNTEMYNLRHKDAQDVIVRAGNNFEMTVQRGGSTWKPSVTPVSSTLPSPTPAVSAGNITPVTKTSLAAKKQDAPLIGSGHNFSPKPFLNGTSEGPIKSIVNKQYNSPVGIYSEETIAETLSAQAEVLAGGVLGVNFKKNEKNYNAENSEVFKMVQEADKEPKTPEPAEPTATSGVITPSSPALAGLRPVSAPETKTQPPSTPQSSLPPGQNICAECERLIVTEFYSSVSHAIGGRATSPRSPTPLFHALGGGGGGGATIPNNYEYPRISNNEDQRRDPSLVRCNNCDRVIVGVFVRIKEKNLHVECFKCSTCGTSLKNVGYYNINNKLYCDIHAKLVARQNAPSGMIPVTMPPGGKAPASTISAALSSVGAPLSPPLSNHGSSPLPFTNCGRTSPDYGFDRQSRRTPVSNRNGCIRNGECNGESKTFTSTITIQTGGTESSTTTNNNTTTTNHLGSSPVDSPGLRSVQAPTSNSLIGPKPFGGSSTLSNLSSSPIVNSGNSILPRAQNQTATGLFSALPKPKSSPFREVHEKYYYYETRETTSSPSNPSTETLSNRPPSSNPSTNPNSVKSRSLAWPPPKPIEDITYPTASPLYIDPNPVLDRRDRHAVKDKRASIEACERALSRRSESTDREYERTSREGYYFDQDVMDRVSCPGPVYKRVELVDSSGTRRESRRETSRASSTDSGVRRSLTPTRIYQPIPRPWTATVSSGGNLYERSYASQEQPKVCKKYMQSEICQSEKVCERGMQEQPYREEHRAYRAEICQTEETVCPKPPLPSQPIAAAPETPREIVREYDKEVMDLRKVKEDTTIDTTETCKLVPSDIAAVQKGIEGEHDLITETAEEDIGDMHVKKTTTYEKTVEVLSPREGSPVTEQIEEIESCTRKSTTKVDRQIEGTTETKTVEESAEVVSSAVDATQLIEQAKRDEEERKREEEAEERRKQEEEERKRREEEERRRREEEEKRKREEEERNKKRVSFREEQEDDEEVVEVIREKPLGRTVIHEEKVTESDGSTPGRKKITKETYEEIVEEVLVQERIKRRDVEEERRKSLREQVEVHQSLRDQGRHPTPQERRVASKYQPHDNMETCKKHVQFMKQTETGPKPISEGPVQNATPKEWKSEMVNALTTASDRPYTPLSTSSSVKELYTEETIYLDHKMRPVPKPKERPISPFQRALTIAPDRPYTPLSRVIGPEDQEIGRAQTPAVQPTADGVCPPADILYGETTYRREQVCTKKIVPQPLPTPPPDYRLRDSSTSPTRSRPCSRADTPNNKPSTVGLRKPDTIPAYQRNLVAMKKSPVEGQSYIPSRSPTPTPRRSKSPAQGPPEPPSYYTKAQAPKIRDDPPWAVKESHPPPSKQSSIHYPSRKIINYTVEEDTDTGHRKQEYVGSKTVHYDERQAEEKQQESDSVHAQYQERRCMTSEDTSEEKDTVCHIKKALQVVEDYERCEKKTMEITQPSSEKKGECSIIQTTHADVTLPCPLKRKPVEVPKVQPTYSSSTEVRHVRYETPTPPATKCPETGVTVLPCKAHSDGGTKTGVVIVPCDGQPTCPKSGVCVMPTSDRSGVCVSPCFGLKPGCCGQPSGHCGGESGGCDFDIPNCPESGVCVAPCPDGSVCVAPCKKSDGQCLRKSRGNLPFPQIPLPYEERPCPQTTQRSFEPIHKPKTNLSGQLARLTAKNRDIPTVQLYKPQPQQCQQFGSQCENQCQTKKSYHCETKSFYQSQSQCQTGSHCQSQTSCQDQFHCPSSKTQNLVDPPKMSSHPDVGTGGLGGSGSKSGSFAGSSAPKRGRGILTQAGGPGSRVPLCAHCNSYVSVSSHFYLAIETSRIRGTHFFTNKTNVFVVFLFQCLLNTLSNGDNTNHMTNGFVVKPVCCQDNKHCTRFVYLPVLCSKETFEQLVNIGPFITALGQIWCPDHFVCVNSQCRRPLQDIGFVEEKGQLYCEYCFEKFIAPSCNKCNNKIKGDCLNAIGKHFHPECFNCSYCGKLFGNSPFFLEEGLPYCEADWNELFTTKCFACGFPVEAGDRWVEALNNNYHSQCFNCTMCKKNLEGQSFYAKGGRPFCKNHAR
ncbi:hypothetical protein HZH68_006545 [Vespula germanica]|uniref:PDZ and LIM domain protein Zasp n=1 Tax=Vespula germanica TaxID=30212 RepID=A0A834KDI0_VESGE|nr:hypothetical protein HZH68_006545 [Vespula germanica]